MKRVDFGGLMCTTFGAIGISLPLIGFGFSVVWSMIFDLDRSTRTHCKVWNILPTVSAAIALTPQAYIWRACIFLHMTPRFMSLFMYKAWLERCKVSPENWGTLLHRILSQFALLGNLVEICGLLGLSVVSSKESGGAHEAFFIAFITGALVFMTVDCMLKPFVLKSPDQKSLARRKTIIWFTNVCCFLLSMYFYVRHNNYCEPGVYSLFALFEYFVIISNVAFHFTTTLEMKAFYITAQKIS